MGITIGAIAFKQKEIKIPNNRSQALKRMQQLKGRLKKDRLFLRTTNALWMIL